MITGVYGWTQPKQTRGLSKEILVFQLQDFCSAAGIFMFSEGALFIGDFQFLIGLRYFLRNGRARTV
jgi:hypothetical protein